MTSKMRPGVGAHSQQAGKATTQIVASTADSSHRLPVAPAAWTTAYSPTGKRRRWAGVVRCPFCRGGHVIFGADLESLRGIKRANCGSSRRIWVVIAVTVSAVEAVPDAA